MNSTALCVSSAGFGWKQEEQVDVGARRQRIAAIAADGGHREFVLLLPERHAPSANS